MHAKAWLPSATSARPYGRCEAVPLPPSSYSNIFQTAYVTHDIAAAVSTFGKVHGVTGFVVAEFALNLTYPPGHTLLKVGLAWAGDHEIELIEPVEDATGIFASALPPGRDNLAFHHHCMRIPGDHQDWAEFRSSIPDEKIVIAGGREGMRFIYIDERPTIGHYLEYIWTTPEFLRAHPHRIPPSRRVQETI